MVTLKFRWSTLYWELFIDESSNSEDNDARIILVSLHKQIFEYNIQFEFSTTDNISKYEAFLAGLGLAEALKDFPLHDHNDS